MVKSQARRSPYGERGLKSREINSPGHSARRSPYGERGLKFRQVPVRETEEPSLSLRRAWIEISCARGSRPSTSRSPYGERGLKFRSAVINAKVVYVALLTESVD